MGHAGIPLFHIKAQYASIRRELLSAVTRTLDSGAYILGAEGAAFEAEFAALVGAPYCVGLASGSHALEVALAAAGVGPGHEAIVPAFTFIATAACVNAVGARPVFADVDPETLTLDPKDVAARVTRRTKALIPVHLYGYPADMGGLLALARRKGLSVIEDCAQAHLTRWRGRFAGSIGDMGCFSFYPTKSLGAAGDAGAVVTRDKGLFEAARLLRNVGRDPRDKNLFVRVAQHSRLDEIQAAVLRVKLPRLAGWVAGRRKAAARYRKALKGVPVGLPPPDRGGNAHSYCLFVVRSPRRDELAAWLAEAGIGAAVFYPVPLHLQPAYAGLGYRKGDFPVSERAAKETLAIPLYPELKASEADRVAARIRAFYNR